MLTVSGLCRISQFPRAGELIKTSSTVRNTAGGRFYDLNELARCRRAWEDTLKIRKELLDHDHPQSKRRSTSFGMKLTFLIVAAIYNNFGNVCILLAIKW